MSLSTRCFLWHSRSMAGWIRRTRRGWMAPATAASSGRRAPLPRAQVQPRLRMQAPPRRIPDRNGRVCSFRLPLSVENIIHFFSKEWPRDVRAPDYRLARLKAGLSTWLELSPSASRAGVPTTSNSCARYRNCSPLANCTRNGRGSPGEMFTMPPTSPGSGDLAVLATRTRCPTASSRGSPASRLSHFLKNLNDITAASFRLGARSPQANGQPKPE